MQGHAPAEQAGTSQSSQSPSRHQRADPRRESTVLFKGFSASTTESGLLEVDEIAHINGSPELFRASQTSLSDPQASAHTVNSVVNSGPSSDGPVHMLPVVTTGVHEAEVPQQQQDHQQQHQSSDFHTQSSKSPETSSHAQPPQSTDDAAETPRPQQEALATSQLVAVPALDCEHSSWGLQNLTAAPDLAEASEQVLADTSDVKLSVALSGQVAALTLCRGRACLLAVCCASTAQRLCASQLGTTHHVFIHHAKCLCGQSVCNGLHFCSRVTMLHTM